LVQFFPGTVYIGLLTAVALINGLETGSSACKLEADDVFEKSPASVHLHPDISDNF